MTELSEQARLKRNEYMRNWARANKEKVKEYQAKHWMKKALEMTESVNNLPKTERV